MPEISQPLNSGVTPCNVLDRPTGALRAKTAVGLALALRRNAEDGPGIVPSRTDAARGVKIVFTGDDGRAWRVPYDPRARSMPGLRLGRSNGQLDRDNAW